MTQEQLNTYLEVKQTIDRMISFIDKYDLMLFEDRLQEKIMAPLLDDGFQQDDIELLLRIIVSNALSNTPKLSEAL